jgi:hypothetical protein
MLFVPNFTQVDQLVLSVSDLFKNQIRGQTDGQIERRCAHLSAFPLHILGEVSGLNIGPSTHYPEGSRSLPQFLVPSPLHFSAMYRYTSNSVQRALLNKLKALRSEFLRR